MELIDKGARNLGIALSEKQLAQFQTYYEELVVWNQQMNLTAITAIDAVQINHFLDSLTVSLVYQPEGKIKALDVGTGAGFPGIPLKIAFPEMHLVLLEATGKKVLFLQHIREKLCLENVQVITGRAEEVAHQFRYRAAFDLVLSRAVAPLVTLVEYTLPFCRMDGLLIAHKKGDIKSEIEQAKPAINILKARLLEVKPVNLPEFPDNRSLVVVKQLAPVPALYPRQSGLPVKKPLG